MRWIACLVFLASACGSSDSIPLDAALAADGGALSDAAAVADAPVADLAAPGDASQPGPDLAAAPWTVDLPTSVVWRFAAVVPSSQRIVLVGNRLSDSTLAFEARDAASGALLGDVTATDTLDPTAMAVDADHVYLSHYGNSFDVYAYAAATGAGAWVSSTSFGSTTCGGYANELLVDNGVVFAAGAGQITDCQSATSNSEWLIDSQDTAGKAGWLQGYDPTQPISGTSDTDEAIHVVSDGTSLYVIGRTMLHGWILLHLARSDGTGGWNVDLQGSAWTTGTTARLALDATGLYVSQSGTPAQANGTGWSLLKRSLSDGSKLWEQDFAQVPQYDVWRVSGQLLLVAPGMPIRKIAPDTGAALADSTVVAPAGMTLFSDGNALYALAPWAANTTQSLQRLPSP